MWNYVKVQANLPNLFFIEAYLQKNSTVPIFRAQSQKHNIHVRVQCNPINLSQLQLAYIGEWNWECPNKMIIKALEILWTKNSDSFCNLKPTKGTPWHCRRTSTTQYMTTRNYCYINFRTQTNPTNPCCFCCISLFCSLLNPFLYNVKWCHYKLIIKINSTRYMHYKASRKLLQSLLVSTL